MATFNLVADPLGGMKAIEPSGGEAVTPEVSYSKEFTIGAWVKGFGEATPVAIWDYTITLDNGSTKKLSLIGELNAGSITLSLEIEGGSTFTFFDFVSAGISGFDHVALTFAPTYITALGNGVVLGPTKPFTALEGVTAHMSLWSMGLQYFDVVLHSKPLSNSTLLYYVQNLGEMNPPE